MTSTQRFARYPSLEGVPVLITGGASGIGASMVEHFALQGAKVAFIDLAVDPAQELIRGLVNRCLHAPRFWPCDLKDVAKVKTVVREVEDEMGTVRVLVNNAANDDRHKLEEITPEYWDDRMAVNLRHQFFLIQSVSPGMIKAGGGSIINMSSIAWMIPSTGLPAYVTAKAAIVGLTRTLAHELGSWNIRVNCVLPGAVLTERQKRLWWTPDYEKEILGRQALKRSLLPEDVARLVLFLASDDSSAITNQSYVVDAGWV
jgi:NAD(P)-dependent dehydrogenase (short-subunit alcohol dehydrogenase family)